MNGNDLVRMLENMYISSSIVTCRHCGKPYHQEREDQVPGFRDMDYDICPYCHIENGRSMSFEFTNTPLSGEELAKLSQS